LQAAAAAIIKIAVAVEQVVIDHLYLVSHQVAVRLLSQR
jgi:hypothetical protein